MDIYIRNINKVFAIQFTKENINEIINHLLNDKVDFELNYTWATTCNSPYFRIVSKKQDAFYLRADEWLVYDYFIYESYNNKDFKKYFKKQ